MTFTCTTTERFRTEQNPFGLSLSKPLARTKTLCLFDRLRTGQAQGEQFCKAAAARHKSTNKIASNEYCY